MLVEKSLPASPDGYQRLEETANVPAKLYFDWPGIKLASIGV